MSQKTRNTVQRRAIQEVFGKTDRPLSPQEVLEGAQATTPGLGIATVYRALKDLVGEGVLVVVELPGEAARYEQAGKEHHHHFHCDDCGQVYEAEGCTATIKRLVPRGFSLDRHEVVLYGRCASCFK